jgi:rhodanese-related sulfurtransferase
MHAHMHAQMHAHRETFEWNGERLPNAEYIGRGTLERDIERIVPDPADLVVLYCAAGARSMLAAQSLQDMGYTNVHSLAGGVKAWKDAGLPTVKNPRVFSDRVEY